MNKLNPSLITSPKLLIILLVFSTFFSCKEKINNKDEIGNIANTYESACMHSEYNLDSAIYLLDQGICKADDIKHDSLIVIGFMYKANFKSQQGDINYADSILNALIYGNQYDMDSSLVNKVKLSYAKLNSVWGNQAKALQLCKEANAYYRGINHEIASIVGYLFISEIYIKQHEHKNAMSALTKALEMSEKIKHNTLIAMAQSELGALHFDQQEYNKSIDCFQVAIEKYSLLKVMSNVAVNYERIGTAYIKKGEYDNAEEYLLKSINKFDEMGMYTNAMYALNNLGLVYENKRNYAKALKCYNDVLEYNQETNIHNINTDALINIGKIYNQKKNYTQAEFYFNKSYKSQIKSEQKDFTNYYTCMMYLNANKKSWKNAYSWATKLQIHSDSLFNIEKFEASEELHTKYETKKKELQLEKMRIEKEKDKLTILKTKIIIVSLSLILLLILLFSYFLRKQYLSKIESYKELAKKSQKIAEINKTKRQQILSNDNIPNITQSRIEDNSEKLIIPADVIRKIKSNLEELIASKFYTDVELSLNKAAEMLDTNARYLSQFINDSFDSNFPTFINQLRIEEAQRLLKDPNYNKLTIEVIGQEAGFKSKSAFNSAFKKETGVTPSFYKKQK